MLAILSIVLVALAVAGLRRGFLPKELLTMARSSLVAARNITIVMLLVGALTALWRAGGTIPTIVSLAAEALKPSIFLPVTFLLNCAISVLTGTSIGTAATMGVICISVGNALGIDPAYSGGAILAGAFFGDRCSPVSTSALLIAEITKTNIYYNMKAMINTSIFPMLVTIALYMWLGWNGTGEETKALNIQETFQKYFTLGWLPALPAMVILILAAFRINVKFTMLASIVTSFIICIWVQEMDFYDVLDIACFGYRAPEEIASMLSGGGILSMVRMIVVVLISLTCAGLCKGLGMLEKIEKWATIAARKTSPFGCVVLTAIATCAVSCNQTLSIVMTNEICRKIVPDNYHRALYLENSSVVIAPLIPWTVASLIPIGTIDAPTSCILFAFLLFLIPAENLFRKKIKGFYSCEPF